MKSLCGEIRLRRVGDGFHFTETVGFDFTKGKAFDFTVRQHDFTFPCIADTRMRALFFFNEIRPYGRDKSIFDG